jgi:hypothetical protein
LNPTLDLHFGNATASLGDDLHEVVLTVTNRAHPAKPAVAGSHRYSRPPRKAPLRPAFPACACCSDQVAIPPPPCCNTSS